MNTRVALLASLAVGIGAVAVAPATSTTDRSMNTLREAETVEGRIVMVDREAKTFTLLVERAPDEQHQPVRVPLTWTDDTECLLDGAPVDPALAINVPYAATVTHEDKVAIRVDATKPPERVAGAPAS